MSDLDLATRELFVRGLQHEVYYKTPFIEELERRSQITYKAGKYIEKLASKTTSEDMWQEYTTNEPLRDEKAQRLGKPRFFWKKAAYPLRYDIDEYTQNILGGTEIQLLDLAQDIINNANRDSRLFLCAKVFNSGTTTGVGDSAKSFQSLVSALRHDTTYGGIARSLSGGTNDWWQGADSANLTENITSSSQTSSLNITISNLRKWVNETDVAHFMEAEDDLMVLVSPTNWDKLAAEAESKVIYKPGGKQKQGIRSMRFADGDMEIVSVPYLQKTSTTKTWLFILNLKYWELRIHTARKWKITDYKWQGENSNGYDYWLARMMVIGNLICWKPNSSLFLTSVS